jgi:CopG family transcriptional regulator, nickel-responsive regulator
MAAHDTWCPIHNRRASSMQRITVTVDDDLMADLSQFVTRRGYANRSEAVRDLARAAIQQAMLDMRAGTHRCVGAVIYVYKHSARRSVRRLAEVSHDRHDLSRTTLRIDLDHDRCLEVMVLQGRTDEVTRLSDQVIAQRGVRHGRLVMVPIDFKSKVRARKRASARGHPHMHQAS